MLSHNVYVAILTVIRGLVVVAGPQVVNTSTLRPDLPPSHITDRSKKHLLSLSNSRLGNEQHLEAITPVRLNIPSSS